MARTSAEKPADGSGMLTMVVVGRTDSDNTRVHLGRVQRRSEHQSIGQRPPPRKRTVRLSEHVQLLAGFV